MDIRHQELMKLKAFTDSVEKEVTLLLQNLQWDPKLITEKCPLETCKCDPNHRIPFQRRDIHEKQCHLTKLGYQKEETFLPDPVDSQAETLVKFSKQEITEIINKAANDSPFFKKVPLTQGIGCQESEPLTVERLQRVYTADERRAIHDAVVNAAPFCHDLTGLDLLSSNDDAKASQKKSRLEILAELRNMKRRRAKYRVAPKTRNYSDVLRDVIKTQMDAYGEATRTIIKTEYGSNVFVSQNVSNISSEDVLSHKVTVKLEKESEPCPNDKYQTDPRERCRARSREKRYDRKAFRDDFSSKERDNRRQSDVARSTEKRREMRSYDDERRREKDKYSSTERRKNHDDHQKEDGRKDKSQKRHSDSRSGCNSDYSSRDGSRNYESNGHAGLDIQERAIRESDPYSDDARDRSRDRSRRKEHSHHDYKNKHSKRERSDKHARRSSDKVIKQEKKSPTSDSYNGETSRKRCRSRSKERRYESKTRRHDVNYNSSKRDKEYHRHKINQEFTPRMIIKQERMSP